MWGLPVVATKAQAQGTFTVGGFDMASQVWDRMNASIEVSLHDRDNFVKNMLTILCEERLAVAHYRPAAIVKGAFAVPAP
jgi:HK97 family phage major capsid protein